MTEAHTDKAKEYIKELFEGNSGGHDYEHSLRVYVNAMRIAEYEKDCDRETVALAALLHDADDHKLFRTEDNANARRFLAAQGIDKEKIDSICRAINSVSFSQNKGKIPDTLEGRIVQDADRLDAIGAIGIARTFAFGGEHGRPMSDSVQHFYDKLLLLKDMMTTDRGRELAEERHKVLLDFLEEYKKETE